MLARLENALGCPEMAKRMVLVPKQGTDDDTLANSNEINLLVAYNASPHSQTALDLTLWIAHQTRLATQKSVMVQVIYVVDKSAEGSDRTGYLDPLDRPDPMESAAYSLPVRESGEFTQVQPLSKIGASLVAELPDPTQGSVCGIFDWQMHQFEQADHILWQARHLADEWRGSLKTHLRFGNLADELRQVVKAESATVLVLGCKSSNHSLVQQLEHDFPCPILGIPSFP
ncbi:universal stress protein [Phormidium sp. CLA17]|uniref:universal stress protein n=1 Tax=Leptolyngbya sp. Cla-17 TaxID=2803751 RepID=UPI001491EB71|nr:universal stress protein [Leptolyngbya sp. Cla-17]MBM0742685.1 universal stress protein [Leptolyngbya sp. Cla-17]